MCTLSNTNKEGGKGLAKLNQITNPLTGAKDTLTLSSIWSYLLGGVFIFFAIATAQNLSRAVSSKIPALDTQIDPLVSERPKIIENNKRYV